MKEVYLKAKMDTKDAEKKTKDLNEGIKETKGSMEGVTDAADKFTGGMVSSMRGAISSVKSAIKGFKSLRMAVMSTGIGAIVIAVVALVQAFKRSEEGQNKFAKLMAGIRAISDVLLDRLASLGELIIDVFTKPQEVLQKMGNAIQEYVLDKVEGVKEAFSLFGKAAKSLFGGDFKEAAEIAGQGIVTLRDKVNPLLDVVKSTRDAVVDLAEEVSKESKEAMKIADMRAKAEKMQRDLIVERAQAERDRSELMEKSIDKENFTLQERIAFTQQAAALEEEITNKEIAAAKLRLKAKQQEMALGLVQKEDLEEEAMLKAELIQLETNKLNKQKETTAQIIGFKAEEKAELDRIEAEKEAERKEKEAKELEDAKELARQKLEIEKEANDKRKEQERLTQDAIGNIHQNGLAAIGQLAELFAGQDEKRARKAFAVQKALQIGQTLMDTYGAVMGAMQAKGPDGFLPFYVRLANAAIAGTAGLANVARIRATEYNSSSSGAIGQPTAVLSEGGAPSISTIGGTQQTQIGALFNQSKPQRAYVTQGDINTAGALDRHVMQNATLGG